MIGYLAKNPDYQNGCYNQALKLNQTILVANVGKKIINAGIKCLLNSKSFIDTFLIIFKSLGHIIRLANNTEDEYIKA